MSFHPENYDGFTDGEVCPYCKSSLFQYLDKIGEHYGISDFFQIDECKCAKCGKKFALVSFVEISPYGSIPMEEYAPRTVKNGNRKPKIKKKPVKPTKKKPVSKPKKKVRR